VDSPVDFPHFGFGFLSERAVRTWARVQDPTTSWPKFHWPLATAPLLAPGRKLLLAAGILLKARRGEAPVRSS